MVEDRAAHHPPEETIDAALAELGWRRGDVDIVINTHLHYDHAENNLAFPQAQFYVSEAEWHWAVGPQQRPGMGATTSTGLTTTSRS